MDKKIKIPADKIKLLLSWTDESKSINEQLEAQIFEFGELTINQ